MGISLHARLAVPSSGSATFHRCFVVPSNMAEHEDFADYFQSRRKTFYSVFTLMAVVDLIDTAIKGMGHFHGLGIEYTAQQAVIIPPSVIAIFIRSTVYQGIFVSAILLYKAHWIYRLYGVLH
jgi:hypothetical protein